MDHLEQHLDHLVHTVVVVF